MQKKYNNKYIDDAKVKRIKPRKNYIIECILKSATPFYCQIPFKVVDDDCCVVDLRGKDNVSSQLNSSKEKGYADNCWL